VSRRHAITEDDHHPVHDGSTCLGYILERAGIRTATTADDTSFGNFATCKAAADAVATRARDGRPSEQIGGSTDGLIAREVGRPFTSGCRDTSKTSRAVTPKVTKALMRQPAAETKRPRQRAARPDQDAKRGRDRHGWGQSSTPAAREVPSTDPPVRHGPARCRSCTLSLRVAIGAFPQPQRVLPEHPP
jgi:hypothetical protein